MTKTRISKLTAVFLTILMTLALGTCANKFTNIKVIEAIAYDANTAAAIDKACDWAVAICNDNSHGYGTQGNINGPDYACTTLIAAAYTYAGIPFTTDYTCGDWDSKLPACGFERVDFNPSSSAELQRGDIVWNGEHVELYIGDNQLASANSNRGYPQAGDQTGTEVHVHKYYSGVSGVNWKCAFRLNGGYGGCDDELGIPYPRPSGSPLLSTGSKGSGVSWLQTALNKANNAGLAIDGDFGSGTKQAVINFQKANGLDADGIAGPATVNKLVEIIKGKSNINLAMSAWLSSSKMGSEVSTLETYNWYYLCYKIYDKNSSKLLSEVVNNYLDYSITEIIYNPDGSVFNSCTYNNSDNNWIGVKPSIAGTYKWKIILNKGGKEASAEREFIVNKSKPNLEAPNLNVDVNNEEVTFSWNLVDNATGYDLRIYYSNGTSYADYWDFSSNEHSLTITMPENTEFYAAVCSKNSNYDECWSYGQQVSFITGVHEHEWDNWTTDKSATCQDVGIEIRNCKKCDKNETRSIPATGHSWSEWKTVKEATCIKNGEMTRKCSVCHAEEGKPIISTMHKYESTTVSPTYTENGYTLHKCSVCGNSYKDNYTEKLAANPNVDLICDKVIAMPGETVKIGLFADSHGAPIQGFDIKLNFDENKMKLTDINTDLYDFIATTNINNDIGVAVGYYPYKDGDGWILTSEKPIVTYTFELSENASPGTCDINIFCSEFYLYGDSVQVNLSNLKDAITITENSHTELRGDLNADNKLSVSDVVLMQKYLVKKTRLSSVLRNLADLNNDGTVNVFDCIILKRRILKGN